MDQRGGTSKGFEGEPKVVIFVRITYRNDPKFSGRSYGKTLEIEISLLLNYGLVRVVTVAIPKK